MSDETLGRRFKHWFWRPPRPHGEVIAGRTVSVLELFYDLVYVAVIGQAAHHLAEHVTARGVVEFAILFALIWIAWSSGSACSRSSSSAKSCSASWTACRRRTATARRSRPG